MEHSDSRTPSDLEWQMLRAVALILERLSSARRADETFDCLEVLTDLACVEWFSVDSTADRAGPVRSDSVPDWVGSWRSDLERPAFPVQQLRWRNAPLLLVQAGSWGISESHQDQSSGRLLATVRLSDKSISQAPEAVRSLGYAIRAALNQALLLEQIEALQTEFNSTGSNSQVADDDSGRTSAPSLEGSSPLPVFAQNGLTGREMEVANLILEGKTNRAIAEELFISFDTVKSHCKNLFAKLGIHRRAELFRLAR